MAKPRHDRDAGRAGSREQRKGEKGQGKEEGESELTTEGRWRRGRMASGWVRTATRRRGRESRALGVEGRRERKGEVVFGGADGWGPPGMAAAAVARAGREEGAVGLPHADSAQGGGRRGGP
jgi:hypothetical protein